MQPNTVESYIKALSVKEYYNMPLTIGHLQQFDEDSREIIIGKLEDGKEGVVLPLRKKYSLSVDDEINLDDIDNTPTDNLATLASQIAQLEEISQSQSESIIKKFFDSELDTKCLPLSWLSYISVLSNAYYEVMFGSRNQKVIKSVLSDRGIKLPKHSEIPLTFILAINKNFITKERNAWVENEESSEGNDGDLGRLESLTQKISELTGTISGLTSRVQELESLDTKAISVS